MKGKGSSKKKTVLIIPAAQTLIFLINPLFPKSSGRENGNVVNTEKREINDALRFYDNTLCIFFTCFSKKTGFSVLK